MTNHMNTDLVPAGGGNPLVEQPDLPQSLCGWVKAYHSSGLLVTLPVPTAPDGVADYRTAFTAIDAIIAAGFAPHAPGLEAGEEKDLVAYVVHGQIESQRGETTDFLLLYNANDAYRFSFLKVYLNRPEDAAAFEFASGMKLADFAVYVGQDKPERGKNKAADKFIVPVRKHFGVVFKQNPKWTQEGADAAKAGGTMYTVPRRVFVRWAEQRPASEEKNGNDQAHAPTAQELDAIRGKWKRMFETDPPIDVFNEFCAANFDDVPAGMRGNLSKAVDAHAVKFGWAWDGTTQSYTRATEEAQVPF